MKNLTIVLASILLALGLPSAAFANENVEASIGGEDAEGDKIDVVAIADWFGGPMEGYVKIDCKDEQEEDVEQSITDSMVFGDSGGIVMHFETATGFLNLVILNGDEAVLTRNALGSGCTFLAVQGDKELDVSIKLL